MKSKILCGYFVGVRAAFMERRFLVLTGRQIDPRTQGTTRGAPPCGGRVRALTVPRFLLPQILSLSLPVCLGHAWFSSYVLFSALGMLMELPFQHQSLGLLYKTCSVQRPCLDGKENGQVPADPSRIHLGTPAPQRSSTL